MQIKNHLDEAVSVFWSEDGEVQSASNIGSVKSGCSIPVPVSCFHYPDGGFFFQPDVQRLKS